LDHSEPDIRNMLKILIMRLREYVKGSDPLTNTAGVVALVVAANQPFYPLFLYAVVGGAAWPAWLTLLSTPFFAAVPSVARRHSLAGRALLPLVGTANTVLSVKLFGVESAAQLFLLPCVLLGSILFRPGERAIMAMVLSVIFLAYVSLGENLGSALNVFSPAEYKSMVVLHAVSVAALTAFIGLLFSSIFASREVGTNRRC
jgi:hypothetical protein